MLRAFSMPNSMPKPRVMSKKPGRGQLHTRANLPEPLIVSDEEPEPEPDEPDIPPLRRVPYTMHIVSQFPNNKHLQEDTQARKLIEYKIKDALDHLEDLIRHIEVNLQVSEHFHSRPKSGGTHLVDTIEEDERSPMEQEDLEEEMPEAVGAVMHKVLSDEVEDGARILSPYAFKITVFMLNGHTIVLGNPEKHAQASLIEGLDHSVDVLVKAIREEKHKMVKAQRKPKDALGAGSDMDPLEDDDFYEDEGGREQQEDAKREQFYRQVEATMD